MLPRFTLVVAPHLRRRLDLHHLPALQPGGVVHVELAAATIRPGLRPTSQ